MPYLRRKPRLPPSGRVTVRLTTRQRDLLIEAGSPKDLSHALHRAPVTKGKLSLRVKRESLDALILAAAESVAPSQAVEREVSTLLRYLESVADQFADTDETEAKGEPDDAYSETPDRADETAKSRGSMDPPILPL